jgi:hypothetical protein
MNYRKIYYKIIENRKQNLYIGYTESHHILPRSLGGSDEKDNLVDLSAKEHFICHLLLTKMYEKNTPEYFKMIKAFMMMLKCKSENQKRFMSSKNYSVIREQFSLIQSISQSGANNSQYNNPRNDKTKSKISESLIKFHAHKGENLKKNKKAKVKQNKEIKKEQDIKNNY